MTFHDSIKTGYDMMVTGKYIYSKIVIRLSAKLVLQPMLWIPVQSHLIHSDRFRQYHSASIQRTPFGVSSFFQKGARVFRVSMMYSQAEKASPR